ncbi:MAG: glycosyltransferase [Thermoproteota archaeon]
MITLAMTLKNSIRTLLQVLSGIEKLDYDKRLIKLLFVDGGSTDGTLDILEDFRTRNLGDYKDITIKSDDYDVTEGRNLCTSNSEGELILFIDSDVVVPPALISEVEKDPLF